MQKQSDAETYVSLPQRKARAQRDICLRLRILRQIAFAAAGRGVSPQVRCPTISPQDLTHVADRARDVGLWRLPIALEYLATRAPDARLRAINGAGPETGSKRVDGGEASNPELDAFHRLNLLRKGRGA